ncbi:PAS domain S-box-containing protein [Azospirillum sp. RU38E]|nr:PAS domain S-box-containing protein [Azospirillum sp. RU38E]SNT30999.1 PAS domain S-box-containing protein [Azospirillum sp. RU37A]
MGKVHHGLAWRSCLSLPLVPPLRRPLVLLLLAAILLPGTTVGLISWRAYEHTLESARDDRHQQARALREHMMRVFEAQSLAIELIDTELGDTPWPQVAKLPRLDAVIRRVVERSPHIESLWLIDPDGRVVAGGGPAEGSKGALEIGDDVSRRSYFQALRKGADTYLTVDAAERSGPAISFSLARRRGEEPRPAAFDGAILVTIQLSYFEQFWRDYRLSDQGVVTLLRGDGELLARYPVPTDRRLLRLPANSSFFLARAKNNEEGDYRFNSLIDGVDRIYSYVRIPEMDSYIVVGTDRSVILVNWWQDTLTLSIIALLLTLALVAAALQAMRRGSALAHANHRLTALTDDLAAEVTRRRAAESTLVAREEHEAALHRASEALGAGEERFRLLFETLTQGVVIHDAAGRILSANAAAEQILGRTLAEMVGPAGDGVDWGAVDAEGQRVERADFPVMGALTTGRVVHGISLGIYNPRRSERRWLVIDAVPIQRPGDSAPSGAYAVFSDVTERRRGEQAQRLLIREVDHRAKNALAVVQAVIRLTKAETPHRFVEVVEGRVAALAHAHTILAMNRWEGALLRRLVQVELEAYDGQDGGRVEISGPDITVRPEAAQPLSMVLHELTTNAAKHGALAQPDGRLYVRWAVIDGGDAIQLDWQETGGPALGDGPARRGFGSTMIEASMRQQLQGGITYDWTYDGLHATIRFPADQLAPLDTLARGVPPDVAVDEDDLPVEPAGQTGPRILLVEDNIPLGQLFREMLEALDYAVIGPYTNVPAALAAAHGKQIDAAMLDIEMNGAQVFPVAEALRHRGIPMLFCTGYSDVWEPEWADVPILRKPVTLPALRDRLAALLPGA